MADSHVKRLANALKFGLQKLDVHGELELAMSKTTSDGMILGYEHDDGAAVSRYLVVIQEVDHRG